MAGYKPTMPYSTPLILLIPSYSSSYGVEKKTFPEIKDGILFFASFKTYGGTERNVNGVYSVEDTAIIETWYRPDIKSDCRIAVPQSGYTFEILGEPENIEMRNQWLKFKVMQVKGGA